MQKPKSKNDKPGLRSFFLYLLILIALISVFRPYWVESTHPRVYLTFSQFVDLVDGDKVKKVVINQVDSSAMGDLKDGTRFRVNLLQSPSLISTMKIKNVDIEVNNVSSNWFSELLGQVLVPILLFAGIWFFIFRQAQGMNSQAMAFGKSKVKMFDPKSKKISFKDVAGVDEAIEELKEIVEFLKSPTKFHNIGAKIPKGVLLMGPPGCGKTLLARAVAGEANVSFFSISGSDFVEMFVGVGASRVRDLFNQAKKNQPAIVFMDEIDAVGRHRGAGLGGGHDEREQTLNQLLVEMDGFDNKSSVIVIAATNRPDILDPALLRPGRFDRQVVVDAPDVRGREKILEIHCRNVKLASNIKLDVLAKRTPGFTGADLANLVNEGALLAARHDKKIVDMSDLEDAIDRVIAGPEKKSKIMQPHDREVIAYHETGHALVAHFSLDSDPVHKISILPRGMALGYTLQLPDQDKYLVTKQQLKNELAVLMGGRTAEEMIFGEITTGASNDIERATSIAHKMVCTYGMSSLGNRTFGQKPQNVFLGRDLTQHSRDFGDHLADDIDKAMNTFIDDAHEQAKKILTKHEKKLHEIARALLKEEVLDGELLKKLLGEKKQSKVKNRSQGGDVSDNSLKIPPMLNPGTSLA